MLKIPAVVVRVSTSSREELQRLVEKIFNIIKQEAWAFRSAKSFLHTHSFQIVFFHDQ